MIFDKLNTLILNNFTTLECFPVLESLLPNFYKIIVNELWQINTGVDGFCSLGLMYLRKRSRCYSAIYSCMITSG